MAQVIIRNLDASVLDRLRRRAEQRRMSLEESLRQILAAAARQTPEERLARMRRIRAMTPTGRRRTGAALIREDRDRR